MRQGTREVARSAKADGFLCGTELDACEVGALGFDNGIQVYGAGTLEGLSEDLVADHIKNLDLNRIATVLGEIQDAVVHAETSCATGSIQMR